MIEVAILKSFDSTDYRAEVQLAGSLSAYFDDVPVARNIAASQMTVGRLVLVISPDDNPRNAAVVAVWDRAAGGGGFGDHGQLSGLGDDDHTQYALKSAFEDHDARHDWLGADELRLEKLMARTDFLNIDWQTIDMWTQVNSGSGGQTIDLFACDLYTGATSGSSALIRNTNDYLITMRNPYIIHRYYLRNFGFTQTDGTIWLGVFRNATTPSDTAIHIGFKIINGRVYATTGDGTNQTITDTGDTTLTGYTYASNVKLTALWSDNNTAKFYVGTTLVATHTTNLPALQAGGRAIYQITNSAAVEQKIRIIRAFYAGNVL